MSESTSNPELRMIKLVTGEVVIGELLTAKEQSIILGKPLLIAYDAPTGAIGMVTYDEQYTEIAPQEKEFNREYIIDDNIIAGANIQSTVQGYYDSLVPAPELIEK